jgi:acetyl/propionyl-CoA carboxylase alpha subunit
MSAYVVTKGGVDTRVEVTSDGGCRIDGTPVQVELRASGAEGFSLLLDGESYFFLAHHSGDCWDIRFRGVRHAVNVETERQRLLKAYTSSSAAIQKQRAVTAPMPALVVRIAARAGDSVAPGTGLLVLEAMKMENEIKAQSAGVVKEVLVKPGQAVEKGEVLLLLE